MTLVACQTPQAIVFMKVGFHGRETLKEILERKTKEEGEAGVILWGYGGTLCHPLRQVRPFVEECKTCGLTVSAMMAVTPSKFNREPTVAKEVSEDGTVWEPIPHGVKVTSSRYALVMRDLKSYKMELDLNSYVIACGPSKGRRLGKYIRGHVDKGCATYATPFTPKKPILIAFTAVLSSPYAVFVR